MADVTIPERLFSLREYQIHWYRWTARAVKEEVESGWSLVSRGDRSPGATLERVARLAAELWDENERRMEAAFDAPLETLRSKQDVLTKEK